MADLLAIENLRAGYGEAVVLPDLSLSLAEGEVLALLRSCGTQPIPTSGRGPGSAGCRRNATSSAR